MKNFYIRWHQKHIFPAENRFQALNGHGEERCGQWRKICNIQYGTIYPNSFLDIYLGRDNKEKKPLIFFVHGGGFTWGSKDITDPNAGKSGSIDWYFRSFLIAGYHVAAVDYALAPDYRYPVPVLQLGEAIAFLNTVADEYGLDMNKVILAGSSAGGQLIGQFANIQTNPGYAQKVNIVPVMKPGSIKGCLFNSALLIPEYFDAVYERRFGYMLKKCGEAYFGDKLRKCNDAKQANVIKYVTADFPPSFISDANTASFYEQARELYLRLKELGIPTELNIYSKSEITLNHGYENFDTQYGKDNMKKMLIFLENKVNKHDICTE